MLQDLRFGFRMLLRSPLWTLAAALTLALGIGANSAIFSFVNAALFRSLPYPNSEQLVVVWGHHPQIGREVASYPDFVDWRTRNTVFQSMVAMTGRNFNITGADEPERVSGYRITDGFFAALGVQPILGRSFHSEEFTPGKGRVALLGESYWRRRFGGDPSMLGRALTINGQRITIVGIVPQLQLGSLRADLFSPLDIDVAQSGRRSDFLFTFARLKPAVSLQQAQEEMSGIAHQLQRAYPETNASWNVSLVPLREQLIGPVKPMLFLMLAVVGCVLLIGCVNVGSLLLARATGRTNEIAVRVALGASSSRIARQLLTESCMLSLIGGALGALFALWLTPSLVSLAGSSIPPQITVSLDVRVAIFTGILSVITGIFFGVVPVWRIHRTSFSDSLKTSGRTMAGGSARVLSSLTVVEIAISLMLLSGAGLLLRSFLAMRDVNPGFQPKNLLSMRIALLGPEYGRDEARARFFDRLTERIASIPGVEAAAACNALPLTGTGNMWAFAVEGRPVPAPGVVVDASFVIAHANYFATLRIPLLRGRGLQASDGPESPKVAVINEAMAARHFPDQDPIGKRINYTGEHDGWVSIVGIVNDVKQDSLRASVVPEVFLPHTQAPSAVMSVVVRSTMNSNALAAAMRAESRKIDRNLPVFRIETVESIVEETLDQPRLYTMLTACFAGVALLLAAIGIYGVMAYSVAQRTREIGVRLALGATRGDILAMVVRQTAILSLAGIGVGAVLSIPATRLANSFLFGVQPYDPISYLAGALLVLMCSAIACWLPAWRASRVDPMPALRAD